MKNSTKYYALISSVAVLYFLISKAVFDRINSTINIVIDELFHIPQGLLFCNYNFTTWDPKITTLPGLYLVTAGVIGPYFSCNTYNLRFINLIGSCFNFLLFASILKYVYRDQNQLKIVLQALNLTLLPPLYFFSHVYYTDTLSLMFLLVFSRLCIHNNSNFLILLFGLGSVLMRQTNVIWIAMFLGHKMLDILIRSSRVFGNSYLSKARISKKSLIAHDIDKSKLQRYYGLYDALIAIKYHLSTCFVSVFKIITFYDWIVISQEFLILMAFSVFLYINGSIVVGDKQAHQPTIHIPQLLYFLLFYGVFGLPYVLAKGFSTIKLISLNKTKVLLIGIIFGLIVHYNTVVHPYLLADNRHYVFYIWNRWFGKYEFAIYATIPAYIFLLFSLYDNLKDQNCISFLLPYSVCLFLALGLQKLVEIRYFLVPYIILRLRFARPSFKVVIAEFILYLVINVVTFNIFFNKLIVWNDFDEVQRIIW